MADYMRTVYFPQVGSPRGEAVKDLGVHFLDEPKKKKKHLDEFEKSMFKIAKVYGSAGKK